MSVIRPFKGIGPKKEYAAQVAALPYDVMNSDEAREMVKGKPYSFLHVDKAEVDLPEETYIYDEKVYLKARENLDKLSEDGICVQDSEPCLYIYRQIMNGRTQTGIVGCASIDDYINNVIKKHELTRADKEADRINHVDYCDANTGPIFLTYRGNESIDKTVEKYTKTEPEYAFTTEDGVRNTVWVIKDKNDIEHIAKEFEKIESLYIADGHHRAASAVKVGEKRRKAHPGYDGTEEFNFFLAVYFKSEDLRFITGSDCHKWDEYPEDHTGEGSYYTPITFDLGYSIKSLVIGVGAGPAIKTKYRNCFDDYHILGDNGYYYKEAKDGVSTDYKAFVKYKFSSQMGLHLYLSAQYTYRTGAGIVLGFEL